MIRSLVAITTALGIAIYFVANKILFAFKIVVVFTIRSIVDIKNAVREEWSADNPNNE